MSKTIEQRPPQVTMAAVIIMAASTMVVLTAWERVSNLRSLESRNAVEEFLAQPPGDGLGLGIESVLGALHVAAVVAAVCATATAILGFYVLRRDKTSRRVLAVLAGPLFVAGMMSGGIAGSFVAAGVVMLFMPPAAEWFATGRWTPPPPRERAAADRERREQASAQWPPSAPPSSQPGPSQTPYATPPALQHLPPPPWMDQPSSAQHAPAHLAEGQRPGALVAAFVITVVSAFIVGLVALVAVGVVAAAPDLVMDQLEQQQEQSGVDLGEISLAQVRSSTFLSGGTILLMCLGALVGAGFALGRRDWARRTWVAAAGISAVGSLIVVLTSGGSMAGLMAMPPGVAAMITLGLLRRDEVRRWFAAPREQQAPPRDGVSS